MGLLVLLQTFSYSQNNKKQIESADDFMKQGDYYSASLNYKSALDIDSTGIDLMNKYADANRLSLNFKIAEHWYNKVYSIDKGKEYPDVTFWLAMVKKSNGKYKEAQKLFTKYHKKYKKKKTYLAIKAEQEASACEYAQIIMANTQNTISIEHLDSTINTINADFNALEITDSNIYFSSMRTKGYSKLYTAESKQIKELSFSKNSPEHIANVAISTNGEKIYFTKCNSTSNNEAVCELFVSELTDTVWQKPVKLNDEINLKGYTSTQPAIGYLPATAEPAHRQAGNDSIGEILFFVSDRPGGQGKLDVWASNISPDGKYGKPYNLGKPINSIDNEITPFFCNRCQALFFSSDWHKGLGGYDIFHSYWKNDEFSEPENMEYPINSSYNDLYFTINPKGTRAYLTSNRIGSYYVKNETCCNDIYRVDFPVNDTIREKPPADTVKIMVTQLKLLVPLTLYFHNDEPDNKTLSTNTNKNYKKTYDDYVELEDKYKSEYSAGLKGEAKENAITDIEGFFEDSVETGMQNLEKFAKILVKVLQKGEYVKITMKGYCSPLASTEYNVNLAKRRISSLKNYFYEYENGILKQYENNTDNIKGKLELFEEDIGELKAPKEVSDNPNDVKNSVYSRAAALERKIQIIAVSTEIMKLE